MVRVMQILLLVGSIGTFIFLSASCGGNVWVKAKLNSDATEGLWKVCSPSKCKNLDDQYELGGLKVPGYLKTCRAFAVISVLAAIAGIVFAILSLAVEKMKGFIASIFLLIAAGTMVVALIVYVDKTKFSVGNITVIEIGWSYVIGWIGVIGGIAAGIMGFFAEKC